MNTRDSCGTALPDGPARPGCRDCRHFFNDAADLEAALPGLASLSSAYAAVRSADGLCRRHERYVTASSSCPAFTPARTPSPISSP